MVVEGRAGCCKAPGKVDDMKSECLMQAHQLEKFAQFLEAHPAFSPLLIGENALVCGFQVGSSFLGIDDMETIIATEPHFQGSPGRSIDGAVSVLTEASTMGGSLNSSASLGGRAVWRGWLPFRLRDRVATSTSPAGSTPVTDLRIRSHWPTSTESKLSSFVSVGASSRYRCVMRSLAGTS